MITGEQPLNYILIFYIPLAVGEWKYDMPRGFKAYKCILS